MRKFRRILFILAVILVIAIIAGGVYIHHIGHRALPDYNKDVTIKGVENEVEVYRDSLGVPHIYAQTEEDLYTAVGYLMAQDRLWQMDLFRRVTQGRLAEIFGEKMVENDFLMRSLRIPAKSKKVLARSDEKIVSALEAFAQGVNEYIDTHSDKLPPEFAILGYKPEKWQPVHTVNLIGYMAWDLTPVWESEVILHKISKKVSEAKYRLLIPKTKEQEHVVFPEYSSKDEGYEGMSRVLNLSRDLEKLGLKVFTGSNNWAVSSEKSETGKPLLANDMHLSLFAPGIWYQMHQVVEGKMNVSGVVLPGQPMVISGHNDSIAWGMTNVMLDDLDFYRETINPEDSSEYKFNGEWRKMEEIEENIRVKGAEPVKKPIRYTHRGPVISGLKEVENEVLSMRWVGNEYSNEVRSVYHLNRASNWSEFKDALRTFSTIHQNIVYADLRGNIGIYCCAGVPVREGSGPVIYPGETDKYDWKGLVPFEELPHAFNPKRGFVASANNKTVSPEYPHHFSHWFDLAPRISRIKQVLKQDKKFSVQDFTELQTDHHSLMVDIYMPQILTYARNIGDKSGQLQEAIEILSEKMGENPRKWEWGKIHQLTLKHPIGGEVPVLDLLFDMNRGPIETGGSFHTVCSYSYSFTNVFNVNHGASHRHVYSLVDWDNSRTVISTGTSGIPASRHYCDQTDTYINRQYNRELFSKETVMKNIQYQMTIKGK